MGLRSIRCGVALLFVFAGVPALAAEQQYSVTHFDTVRMQVPFRVIISTGKGNSGRGEGERDALDRVSLDVSGGGQIGRAHVCTPVINAQLVCRLLLDKNNS